MVLVQVGPWRSVPSTVLQLEGRSEDKLGRSIKSHAILSGRFLLCFSILVQGLRAFNRVIHPRGWITLVIQQVDWTWWHICFPRSQLSGCVL